MIMSTIEVIGWKENFVGFTGWDAHAKSELKRRLRNGIKASPAEIRRLARQINGRQLVALHQVHDEAVPGLTQILETTGADIRVSLDHGNSARLFQRIPKRSV